MFSIITSSGVKKKKKIWEKFPVYIHLSSIIIFEEKQSGKRNKEEKIWNEKCKK